PPRALHSFPTRRSSDLVAALGVIRSADGRWLAGRRAEWVATWAGRWALGAGGAVDLGENPGGTLVRELREEWGVSAEHVRGEARSEEHTSELQSLTNLV